MSQLHVLEKATATQVGVATDGVQVFGGIVRDSAISIGGTFTATIAVQRSLDGDIDANYKSLSPTFTGPAEENIINTHAAWYRLKVMAYTSGTVELGIRS